MPRHMKHILANMNVKLYHWTLTFREVMRQQIGRGGGSFNWSFLQRSFLDLTVKRLWKFVHFSQSNTNKVVQIKVTYFFATRGSSS